MQKLLLVEDDNNLREIYEARLAAEGYTIVSAKDGEEALAVAKAEKPDLVISDVMMPKISGFEMLDILRNTDGLKSVRVIMLTALGQSEDQQRANKLGADRYLVKSQVTLEDIVKTVHDLLNDSEGPSPVPAPAPPAATPPAEPVTPPSEPASPPPAAPVPPAPVPAPTPAPEPVSAPVETPEEVVAPPEPAVEAPAKELAEAIVAQKQPAEATSEPEPTANPSMPEAQEEKEPNDNVSVAHKKVITPPADADSNKPSIQSLLALEQAKESGITAPTPQVVTSDESNTPKSEEQDPTSIAI